MLRRVNKHPLSVLRIQLEWLYRQFFRRRGLIFRILFSCAIGCLALTTDESNSYDKRFNLRGDQKVRHDIVLVNLRPSDFIRPFDVRTKSLAQLGEITDLTDSLFWDRATWFQMLATILEQNPKAVGVTLWFGDNIRSFNLTADEAAVFYDPRVYWSTSLNNLEQLLRPRFAADDLSNIGSHDLKRDDDGIIRRVFPSQRDLPHIVEKLSGRAFKPSENGLVINYRGAPYHSFEQYSLGEILHGPNPETFAGKYVLIGADNQNGPGFLTPLGPMNRSEILAHVLDNQLENRWIKRLPFITYAFLLFLLTLLATFLITTYPQSVVLPFFIWIGTLCAALSAWAFDSFSIWLPAYSPFILLGATWIIFIGYQAIKAERLHAQLQAEQKNAQELEQLKNNFVSLISHDLKTPIAKIQAVTGRLQASPAAKDIEADLNLLQNFSEELNRYIQSILKVIRVESRDFKLHLEATDINEVIESAVHQLKPLARDKGLQLETQLEPMFSVEFDVTLIKEVIINLIENAIKYTPAPGSVTVTSREIDNCIEVKVMDTGQGIAPQDMDLVWQKFVRGKSEEHKSKGTGLGLYLVKYFIELHGGSVAMISVVGKGSTVSFRLPLTPADV